MGGLICRTFLQNPTIGSEESKAQVDKVFTFATPHNGIDVKVLGNLPGFFSRNNANNFNREHMKEYLALAEESANSLGGKFDPERFFCLVGTNAKDYSAASGWSTAVIGDSSDGLVRIENAAVLGAPRAFVHRSHSGHYGIVNSEEGYQNLARFLFGDVRVDGTLVIKTLTLPRVVQKALDDGKEVTASYHFETVVRPRGARYDLHRRTMSEHSAIFRSFKELFRHEDVKLARPRYPRLFSIYLCARNRSRPGRGPLVFAVDLAVKIPEYEIERVWRRDLHSEGSDLFRQTIIIAAVPPKNEDDAWTVRYGLNATSSNPTPRKAEQVAVVETDDAIVFGIPIRSKERHPGIEATLRLTARPWA